MNKKGFTLIELLAVIVILAIIALIATPVVLDIIEDSKESSKLNSANHYLDAVANAIMRYNMNNDVNFMPQRCKIQKSGNLKCEGKDITVEIDGEKPVSGTITFENGNIKNVGLDYGDKYIVDDANGTLIYGEPLYVNGEVVYYDITTGKGCKNYHEDNSLTGYNGIYEGDNSTATTENQNSCLKFYAFNYEDGAETLNLLLDHNTTSAVAWNSSMNNKSGPSQLLTQLYNDTKDWNGTMTPEDYTMDQSLQTSGASYIVEYSDYKARLITAQEVAEITGADIALNWNEELSSSGSYWFDTLTPSPSAACTDNDKSTKCKYGWLYDRIGTSCTDHGCLNNSDVETIGYWTVSSSAFDSRRAWRVFFNGGVGCVSLKYTKHGVRPVIEIPITMLSQ